MIDLLPWILLSLFVGIALSSLFYLIRRDKNKDLSSATFEQLRESLIIAQAAEKEIREQKDRLELQQEKYRSEILEFSGKIATRDTEITHLKNQIENLTKEQKTTDQRLTHEFEVLAGKILDTNSKKFTALQEEKIQHILRPMGERLVDFQKSISELQKQGIQHHTEFKSQIDHLKSSNQEMSDEARNLTRALQGQKTQGLWGEFILERVLESSGLQKDQEYRLQESHSTEEGRKQPDVIIYLPDNKMLIIDAKVSLTAYLRMIQSGDLEEEEKARREHLRSLRSHIDGLSKKAYDKIEGLTSPEFVLLFVAVEPAFTEAIRSDITLFDYAFNRKIILVTPTTLLATLKTVASLWRQEKQTRNAMEIARLGGELYDKFVGFTEDLKQVGNRLEQARQSHDAAVGKLVTGRGNAIRTIEKMKDLGLKTRKEMDDSLLDTAGED